MVETAFAKWRACAFIPCMHLQEKARIFLFRSAPLFKKKKKKKCCWICGWTGKVEQRSICTKGGKISQCIQFIRLKHHSDKLLSMRAWGCDTTSLMQHQLTTSLPPPQKKRAVQILPEKCICTCDFPVFVTGAMLQWDSKCSLSYGS